MTLSLKNKLITIITLGILLTGCATTKEEKIISSIPNINIIEDIPVDYKASLFAVGDALIHDAIYEDAKTNQIGEDGYNIYNFKPMLEYIKPLAQSHDLAFYNQETVIGGKNLGLSNYPMFNSPDEIGINMLESGFNIVNLATNHSMDKGKTGITYSANFWEKQDAYVAGSYTSEEKRNNVEIAEKNGITYAVLAYTYGTNGLPVPEDAQYLVNVWSVYGENSYEEYKETVKQDIQRVRDKVDVLIVSMHWGNEYIYEPTSYERDAAKFLSEQGVDIIIGTLGNFISSQHEENTRVGMMVSLDINKHVEKGETTITIDNVKADLIWTYHQGFRNFKVIPFNELDNNLLNNYQQIYEKYKKIINPTNDERIQVGF